MLLVSPLERFYFPFYLNSSGINFTNEVVWWATVLLVSLTLLGINLKSFQLSYMLQFIPSAV